MRDRPAVVAEAYQCPRNRAGPDAKPTYVPKQDATYVPKQKVTYCAEGRSNAD